MMLQWTLKPQIALAESLSHCNKSAADVGGIFLRCPLWGVFPVHLSIMWCSPWACSTQINCAIEHSKGKIRKGKRITTVHCPVYHRSNCKSRLRGTRTAGLLSFDFADQHGVTMRDYIISYIFQCGYDHRLLLWGYNKYKDLWCLAALLEAFHHRMDMKEPQRIPCSCISTIELLFHHGTSKAA